MDKLLLERIRSPERVAAARLVSSSMYPHAGHDLEFSQALGVFSTEYMSRFDAHVVLWALAGIETFSIGASDVTVGESPSVARGATPELKHRSRSDNTVGLQARFAPGDLADSEFEPSDEDLSALMARAFHGIATTHAASRDAMEERIRALSAEARLRLASAEHE